MGLRLSLFAKGNTDLRDSLHLHAVGEKVLWNGINQVLRDQKRDCTIRVRHETHTCFAAMSAAIGRVPDNLTQLFGGISGHFGPFPLRAQFSDAAYGPGHTAVVLSIQGDISVPMVRHRSLGHLLHPYGWQNWPPEQLASLRAHFDRLPAIEPTQSMADLAQVISRMRETADVPILVFNVPATMPGETVHCYQGVGNLLSHRIRRFNTALADASAELGFSIIDVDRITAEHGARHLKIDQHHLNALGNQLVAEEVVRVLDDHGLLQEHDA